jgi:hypothetical protein
MPARHRVASGAEIAPLVRRGGCRSSAVLVTRRKPGATRGATRGMETVPWTRTTGFAAAAPDGLPLSVPGRTAESGFPVPQASDDVAGAQVSEPGESPRKTRPPAAASVGARRTGPRRMGPVVIAEAGVAGIILTAAVLAGGTATLPGPSAQPSMQPTDAPAAASAPAAPVASVTTTSTTQAPGSSADRTSSGPRTAAPTTTLPPTSTSTAAPAAPTAPAPPDNE